MLENRLLNLLDKIPVVHPLQQFVATNPLADITHLSMMDAIADISRLTDSQLTLPLADYIRQYRAKNISGQAIKQAVSQLVEQQSAAENADSYKDLVIEFVTDEHYQAELIKLSNEHPANQWRQRDMLVAYQLRPYFYDDPVELIKKDCLTWLANFINGDDSLFKSLTVKPALFSQWQDLISHKNSAWRLFLADKPTEPLAFIENLLIQLEIPEHCLDDYLLQILWQLKGWAGYIKWQIQYPNSPWIFRPMAIADLLALWLANEAFWLFSNEKRLSEFKPCYTDQKLNATSLDFVNRLWDDFISGNKATDKRNKESVHSISYNQLLALWQRAYEIDYENDLYDKLINQIDQPLKVATKPAKAQWVFCIDVRSEGLRRHLESLGGHETLGFAGFFGFAYQLQDRSNNRFTCQCPALIEPDLVIDLAQSTDKLLAATNKSIVSGIDKTKKTLLSPFFLFEMLGFWYTLQLVGRNYLTKLKSVLASKKTKLVNLQAADIIASIGMDNAVSLSQSLLVSLGITGSFAETVILCGHGAATENNPFQAALDCGACGGNAGHTNALVACKLLNDQQVRQKLQQAGITIPEQTLFVAANHNTTTDQVEWFDDPAELTERQKNQLALIQREATIAGKRLAEERLADLPGDSNLVRRSQHWAELIPEWGLANNAAMIVAPRRLTAGINLERRVFLHSYEPQQDKDGQILEQILLAPVVVAHWINMQYYFSTVAPDSYGSGNKAIHNVISRVGVMEGNQSDLKYGLPLQSVFYQEQLMHQPRRLLVIVYADNERVTRLINKHTKLKNLVDGQWLILKTIEPVSN
jgi:uncharacterized protein YbcC (UPF0753/DUF2309 family)